MQLDQEERAVLSVLAAGGPMPAREIAAAVSGMSIADAVRSGYSAQVARILLRLGSVRSGCLIAKDFIAAPYRAYRITAAGREALGQATMSSLTMSSS